MSTVRMTGWERGLRKVSLTRAIMRDTGKPLSQAKRCVDDLLDGREVTLEFAGEAEMLAFRRDAEALGARFQED